MLLDDADTALKGAAHWRMLGLAYPLRAAAMLAVAALGALAADRRLQLWLAVVV